MNNYFEYNPEHKTWMCFLSNPQESLSFCVTLLDRIGFEVLSSSSESQGLKLSLRLSIPIDSASAHFECLEINSILNRSLETKTLPDSLVRLCLKKTISQKDLNIFRAYVAYYSQIYPGFSAERLYAFLTRYSDLSLLVLKSFHSRFGDASYPPADLQSFHEKKTTLVEREAEKFFDFLWELIQATVRTNFYLCEDFENQALALKIHPKKFIFAQKPILFAEIFVYHPLVQGLHFRTSPIARGGIRWSDRPLDYRYEVLGLVRAQQIKNTLIVPSGAKGAYVISDKNYASYGDVEKKQKAVQYYQMFIKALLDLTDLSHTGVRRVDLRCYDEYDPYLVVAADKGTATFSDYANALSLKQGHWLGDAFASGGSQGYDHKKLGITAKGVLVSAEHHSRRLDLTPEMTVIGIGDLSGDVFGNGLTLWPQMKLLAAFNHQHIFIDPNPKKEASAERLRLFHLAKSSWADFDRSVLSPGGMIIDRLEKTVVLSEEAANLLGVSSHALSPDECISAILKIPADVLFNGGIGTYIKASSESHLDIADTANDDVRVNAADLRVKAILEGGNLGLSHKARVEFEKKVKGIVNTDTLDNSAGVNCSDHEVNLKIFLELLKTESLLKEPRNVLLERCTQEIEDLVLQDNDQSNYLISFLEFCAQRDRFLHYEILEFFVKKSILDLQTEKFDSLEEIKRRIYNHDALSRAELIVLFGYIKIDLKQRLLQSTDLNLLPLLEFAEKAFPKSIMQEYKNILPQHPLYQQIAITQILNYLISYLGLSFFYRLEKETKKPLLDLVVLTLQIFKIFQIESKISRLRLSQAHSYEQKQGAILGWYRLILRSVRVFILCPHNQVLFDQGFVKRVQAITEKFQVFSIEQNFALLGLVLLNHEDPENDLALLQRYEDLVLDLHLDTLLEKIEEIPIHHGFDAQARTFLREKIISLFQKMAHLQFSQQFSAAQYQIFKDSWKASLEEINQLNVLTFGPVLILTQQIESFLSL